jgi:hypothetical protein
VNAADGDVRPAAGRPALADPEDLVVMPEPTPAELAAILAAYEQLWPADVQAGPKPAPRWRYASRPWTRRSDYRGWR